MVLSNVNTILVKKADAPWAALFVICKDAKGRFFEVLSVEQYPNDTLKLELWGGGEDKDKSQPQLPLVPILEDEAGHLRAAMTPTKHFYSEMTWDDIKEAQERYGCDDPTYDPLGRGLCDVYNCPFKKEGLPCPNELPKEWEHPYESFPKAKETEFVQAGKDISEL